MIRKTNEMTVTYSIQDAFLKNNINGRRLALVDASALSKMGMRSFAEIKVGVLSV
jgi:hypothetical protein